LKFSKIFILFTLLIAFGIQNKTFGQQTDTLSSSVYKVNRKVEIPLTAGLFAGTFFGFNYLLNKPGLDTNEVEQLNPENIWSFDRIASEQDASYRYEAQDLSDFFLNMSVILPGFLMLDKQIRKDWLDLLVLYGETHAINTSVYILTASFFERVRPFVYHPDVPMESKLAKETCNSFYSGHVSTAASSSFFMAKVFSDYHPELGNKKYWLYGAALIPPAMVGIYRIKAMKHFPTDVITGLAIGAAAGIVIPHLHKINRENSKKLSIIPFAGGVSGVKVFYSLR